MLQFTFISKNRQARAEFQCKQPNKLLWGSANLPIPPSPISTRLFDLESNDRATLQTG